MSLPALDSLGELPDGVHVATIGEVQSRFGSGSHQRTLVSGRLQRIFDCALSTGALENVIVFGSFVTAKPDPNDVDVVLVMRDAFRIGQCNAESRILFDHLGAQREFGASVFWIRPGMLISETIDDFIAHWQVKRDRSRRGIVRVTP